ncbi:MAG: 3'(2'),5'-bisphosphate nucleotidase CysQ [Spirochaetales bacterium]|nr:3'(2'),5'-bisphosphate nucleotidase CysQ [Spirochaetales bacterium]
MDTASLQETAIRAALAAGAKILGVYESDDFDVSLKSDDSPLTRADLLSHDTITEILKNRTPHIPILGEEGREVPFTAREKWQTFWLVDPLDGTKEFVKKNGEFTVNIALVENAYPVLGALYVPVTGVIYFAAAGFGSYKVAGAASMGAAGMQAAGAAEKGPIGPGATEARAPGAGARETEAPGTNAGETGIVALMRSAVKLPLHPERRVPPVKVVASRSHYSPETARYVEEIEAIHGKADLVNAGSSLKICLVAEGAADVYPRFGPTMEWDVAAGQIIAEEAGCTVTDADTHERLRYNKPNLLNPYFIVERAGWSG